MELKKVSPDDGHLWEQVWSIYVESFPDHERRTPAVHCAAMKDSAYRTYALVESDTVAAILFYWDFDRFVFGEHLAVSPQMRGKNIGSEVIRELIAANPGRMIVLEIDPPVDEISVRRLGFYRRLGFSRTPYSITHPSYSRSGKPHRLDLLSYPRAMDDTDFAFYEEYLNKRILKGCD